MEEKYSRFFSKNKSWIKLFCILLVISLIPSIIFVLTECFRPKTAGISFLTYKVLRMIVEPSFIKWNSSLFESFATKNNVENVSFVSNGIKIGAFLSAPKIMNEKTKFIVFCHGSSHDRSFYSEFIKFSENSEKNNLVILAIDYREFGDSEGIFTPNGVNDDIEGAVQFLKKKFYQFPNIESIALVGHSLGSAIVLKYASDRKFKNKVVCIAPWSTLICFIKENWSIKLLLFAVPPLWINIKNQIGYDSISNAKVFLKNSQESPKEKLLVIGAGKDKNIKCHHAEKIQKATNCSLLIFKLLDHWSVISSDEPWNQIGAFLN